MRINVVTVSFFAAFTVLAQGAPGEGETVTPRVLVIMDTSKSMTETPDGTNAANGKAFTLRSEPGGDYNCGALSNASCISKFCFAKQALCETLTSGVGSDSLSSSLAVGLASYYQYVLSLSRTDTRTSGCEYDILEKPGKTRSFTTAVDLSPNGSLDSNCNGAGGACTDPAADVDLFGPTSPWGGICSSGSLLAANGAAITTYSVRKTHATSTNTGRTNCLLYNWTTAQNYVGSPQSVAFRNDPPGCNGVLANGIVDSSVTVKYRVPSNGNCSPNDGTDKLATFPSSNAAPARGTPASFRYTGNAGWGSSCGDRAAYNTNCFVDKNIGPVASANYPLDLYLTSFVADGLPYAFSFFDKSVASMDNIAVPPASTSIGGNQFGSASNYTSPNNTGTVTWRTPRQQGGCYIGSVNFANVGTTHRFDSPSVVISGVPTLTSRPQAAPPANGVDVTPTLQNSSQTYTCSPGWPCDITWSGQGTAEFQNADETYAKDPDCTSTTCTPQTVSPTNCRALDLEIDRGQIFYTLLTGSQTCQRDFTSSTSPAQTTDPKFDYTSPIFGAGSPWPATGSANKPCGTGKNLCSFVLASPSAGETKTANCPDYITYDSQKLTVAPDATTRQRLCPAFASAFNTPKTYNPPVASTANVYLSITSGACDATPTITDINEARKYSVNGQTLADLPGIDFSAGHGVTLADGTTQGTQFYYYTTSGDPGQGWTYNGMVYYGNVPQGGLPGAQFSSPQAVPQNNRTAVHFGNNGSSGNLDPQLNSRDRLSNCAALADAKFGAGGYEWEQSQDPVSLGQGASYCGTEGSDQCYTCSAYPKVKEYIQTRNSCKWTLSFARATPTQEHVCGYNLKYSQRQTCVGSCEFSTNVKRYDWTQAKGKECTYRAFPVAMSGKSISYDYSYTTKGGELFGTTNVPFGTAQGASYCSDSAVTYDGTSSDSINFKNSCPATKDCLPGTETWCKLRTDTGVRPLQGRYALEKGIELHATSTAVRYHVYGYGGNTADPNNPTQIECPSGRAEDRGAGYNDSQNPTNSFLASNKSAFCSSGGHGPATTWRLVADWYDVNSSSSLNSVLQSTPVKPGGELTAPETSGWDSAAWSKSSGGQTSLVPRTGGMSGPVPPTQQNQVFVPIPTDRYDVNGQNNALKKALGKCDTTTGAVSVDGGIARWDSSHSGLCYADAADPTAPNWTTNLDFTPLYGSLKHAANYIGTLLDTDDSYLCRNYYVILATDGNENTPANKTQSDLENAVTDLTNITSPQFNRTTSAHTFVIAFGKSFGANLSVLDAMQAKGRPPGGQSSAFRAENQASLKDALATIFASLAPGTFSRSKPSLSTDGYRMYFSTYTKTQGSPEWTGNLKSYSIDNKVGTQLMWEMAPKINDVNNQSDGDRLIFTATDYQPTSRVDFSRAALTPELRTALTTPAIVYGDGGVLSAEQIIDFVRNPDMNQLYPASRPPSTRKSRLGPIVRSSPVAVGVPPYDTSWAAPGDDRSAFIDYVARAAARPRRVLVGSGDGLLHSVVEGSRDGHCAPYDTGGTIPDGGTNDASAACPNGYEAWAFIPPELLPTLGNQLIPTGLPKGIDGVTSVTDICWTGHGATGCTVDKWFTLAIGSLRGGGKSYFALDVTSLPSSAAANAAPNPPVYKWSFTHSLLGYTYSTPAVGRVLLGGNDIYVAIAGGGKTPDNSNQQTVTVAGGRSVAAIQGRSVFVLNAATGQSVAGASPPTSSGASSANGIPPFVTYSTGGTSSAIPGDVQSAIGQYRQPNNPYLYAAYVPVSTGELLIMRFTNANGEPRATSADWEPSLFWSPTAQQTIYASATAAGNSTAAITRVTVTDAGSATNLPTYELAKPSTTVTSASDTTDFRDFGADAFPMNVQTTKFGMKTLLNRPTISAIIDGSGKLPDLFVGTGDLEATSAANRNYKFNYFVAIHDTGANSTDASGAYMWGHYFIDSTEQVVSQPLITPQCIIVATYLPPVPVAGLANCAPMGSTRLYGFDVVTGALVDCLQYAGVLTGLNGKSTSVLTLSGSGPPSNVVSIGAGMGAVGTASGEVAQFKYNVNPGAARVSSFRRIR